jgi:hypothetical protein
MSTDTIAGLTIAVDFGTSLVHMIAAGKYDWVNPYITPERFSVEGTGKRTFRTKLFCFDCSISSDDAVAAMQRENFLPATHVHASYSGQRLPKSSASTPSLVSARPPRCTAPATSCVSAGSTAAGTSTSAARAASGTAVVGSLAFRRPPTLDAPHLPLDFRTPLFSWSLARRAIAPGLLYTVKDK